ncbi:MAG: hypothetical protein GYB26_10110 [Gammaproteobacteria bacterium]|nr:hypothetical protein [Gammaproteobacteria bacterium]
MSEQAQLLMVEMDWEETLLEIQTEPSNELTESHWRLYEALYGLLEVAARKWLHARQLVEARDGALAAVGIDKIFRDIGKFNIPDDSSEGIGRAFRAWAIICCRNEWGKQSGILKDEAWDPTKHLEDDTRASPSPEDLLAALDPPDQPPSRSQTERALRQRILEEELAKLLPSMKDAILATEELKSVSQPNARGKQGEAATIAEAHGHTPGAVRTARSRLLKRAKERFEKEVK